MAQRVKEMIGMVINLTLVLIEYEEKENNNYNIYFAEQFVFWTGTKKEIAVHQHDLVLAG